MISGCNLHKRKVSLWRLEFDGASDRFEGIEQRFYCVFFLLALLLLAMLHTIVFRLSPRSLMVDQPVLAKATTVLLGSDDGQFDRAAELLKDRFPSGDVACL